MDAKPSNSAWSSPDHDESVDRLCDEFESAWRNDQIPRLEDYLGRLSNDAHFSGFCDLLRVELEIRRLRGDSPTAAEYRQRFPLFATQVAQVFVDRSQDANFSISETLTHQISGSGERAGDSELVSNRASVEEPPGREQRTIDHTPSRKESRGLHIRCPHCNNAVELLADTPYADISCSTCGSMFSLVDREESTRMAAPLKTIDRFDLIARLGVGGFGTVWKARDRELDRVVAIKIPRRGQLGPAAIEQFFREARSAAQLRHPNIVPVHEVGREDETLFIVSDFIRGVTLSDWLTGNRPSPREVVALCLPITEALHHAHQQGIIHRDLKPSNIMIDEQRQPWLMDFGLAKREVGEITMTVDGQIVGTPRYMSPEQAGGQGHWTDRRTDIYSLGVMLFEMLTGDGPFRGNAQMQIHQRLTEDAPDPRKLNRHIPRDLSTICLKCLEREPGRRYNNAAELEEELKCFLRGEPIKARPLSAPARAARWAKRKPWTAATIVLTTLLAITGPLAALSIETQRRQLEVRFHERNELIQKTKQDIDRAKATIKAQDDQLSAWTGKAIPSEFWPPKREKPPRQILIADLFDRSRASLAAGLRSGKFGLEETARGYMSLATMAESLDNRPLAKEYYRSAGDALAALRKQDPEKSQFARALAQCEARLANLSAEDDRDHAAKDSDKARVIYEGLATDHKTDTMSKIEWLEAELASVLFAGYDAGKQHLVRSNEIKSTLSGSWPTDPNGVYRAACYLTHEEPILLESPGEHPPSPEAAKPQH